MYYLSKENFQDGTGRYFVANHEDNAYSYAMIKEFYFTTKCELGK